MLRQAHCLALTVAVVLCFATAGPAPAYTVRLGWTLPTSQSVVATPVLGPEGDTVYAGSQSGSFYALSRSAGSPLWIHAVTMGVTSSAAVARDAAGTVVYVGLGVSLQALNATSGLILWTFPTQDWVVSSPLLLPGGTLYVGSNDGSVYAVSAASGQQVWSYTTGGPVGGSVAVSEGVAVFGSSDQNVYGVDAANGTLLWKFATAAAVQSTAALGNGTAYIGSEDGNVYALNLLTGELVWRYITGNGVYSNPAVDITRRLVFATSSDGNLYALSSATGRMEWYYTTGYSIYSSPVLGPQGDLVAFGSNDNNVYAVDIVSRSPAWVFSTQGQVYSSPALTQSSCAIGSNDGSLYYLTYAKA